MFFKALILGTTIVALSHASWAATLDPLLADLLARQAESAVDTWQPGAYWHDLVALETDARSGESRVGVILHLDGALPDLDAVDGLRIGSVTGRIATARLPLRSLAELAAVPGIRHVAAARVLEPTLDLGVPAANVDDVWNGSPAYTGDGVLIGIIDTGIDWSHPDFCNANGTTRIKAIWDIFGTGGAPPTGFSAGVEYTEAAINAALQGGAAVAQQDIAGHGTHVAGICAGNGRASSGQYRGVAFEGSILFAKPYQNGFPEDKTIDAMNYLAQKAQALGRPIAINMSLGGHWGAHDGTSAQEQVVNTLSGAGVVFCIAAGNEGEDYLAEAGPAANHGFVVRVPDYTPNGGTDDDAWLVQLWYGGTASPSVGVQVGGYNTGAVASGSGNEFSTTGGYIAIDNATGGADPANGDKVCYILIDDRQGANVAAADYTITISGGSGTAHAYMAYSTMFCGFINSTQGYSIGMPACAESAVSVAAYKTRNTWPSISGTSGYPAGNTWGDAPIGAKAPFSSVGPTRDGREKPDVSAPGMAIVSCYSHTQAPPAENGLLLPGSKYYATQGTSMATPLTCGVVGLMLEKNRGLTAAQVRTILRGTAAHDAYTGSSWTPTFGAGKVDALAALAAVTGGAAGGDIDADGSPTVLDVILLVNCILDPVGHPLTATQRAQADVYPAGGGDGLLNISDVTRIVAFILQTDTPGLLLAASGPVVVSLGAPYEAEGCWWVPVTIAGDAVAGGQFAVSLDGARWRADRVRLEGGGSVAAHAAGDQLRVLIYDAHNLIPAAGVTVHLPLDAPFDAPSAGEPRLTGLLVADPRGFARETQVIGVAALPPVRFVQLAPNPAPPGVSVQFQLAREAAVALAVHDPEGRRVRELAATKFAAGLHTIGWDGRDGAGRPVAAGLYLVRLVTPEQTATRRVILTR